ncbi:hypothetical protein L6E12_15500 [Actinokineospora sp. PR83]|uniref:hypothetical protein n=1 Tax=Actinokineospora sp. PR83 TaxID=2884908 RepID=UPI001F23ABA0|nr:hypothetical protein [Actinokineospora sp. PR83]MCG8917191.1 hypothetical protein [Actinokineospora sp. PR83]
MGAVQVNPFYPWREEYATLPVQTRTGVAASIGLLKVGDPNASTVVLFLGGKEGAAAGFTALGRSIAAVTPGVQFWALDRREVFLTDTSKADAPLDEALDYYLGGHYRQPDQAHFGEYAEWGLRSLLEDVRVAVEAAAEGGRRVLLGGHSVGAAEAVHYAAWDFDGVGGHRSIDGLVLVDGGVRNAFRGAGMEFGIDLATATGWLGGIRAGGVFETDTSTSATLGFDGPPESTALFCKLAARAVLERPTEVSPLAARLPARYPVPDAATNHEVFAALTCMANAKPGHGVTAGHFEDGAWVQTGPTRLGVVAHAHSLGAGAFQWYTMNRLLLDLIAADSLEQNEITELLDLRAVHAGEIGVPVLAYASAFTNGSALQAAKQLADSSAITRLDLVEDKALSHHDALFADLPANSLVHAVAAFAGSLDR